MRQEEGRLPDFFFDINIPFSVSVSLSLFFELREHTQQSPFGSLPLVNVLLTVDGRWSF
jgi:hypothetical protein